MDSPNTFIRGIKILDVENVKIYQVPNNSSQLSNLTRGKLFIYYFPEYDRYILRLNSFQYALSPYLPILATLNVEHGFRSYILPNIGGHYVLKLKTTPIPAVIKNLETILANYSQFSYQQGQEKALEDQANRRGDYNMNFDTVYDGKHTHPELETRKPQPDNFVKAENAVKLSGEFVKQKLIKAANYIGSTMASQKGQVVSEQNSNQFYPKTIQELKGVSALDNELVDFKATIIQGLITLSNQIEKEGVTTSTIIKPKVPEKQQSNWSELGTTTLHSAKNIWSGMSEAATILSNAWRIKQNNQKNNQAGKPVQFERIDPSAGSKSNEPSGGAQQVFKMNEPVQQQGANLNNQYQQQPQPYVFYEPKYTQPPVIEREEFYEESVSHDNSNLFQNEDAERKNLYPRLETLNVQNYPSYNPYKIDAQPSDATYARVHDQMEYKQTKQTENYEYSHSG